MKQIILILTIFAVLLFLSSCEKDATGIDPGMARLNIYVTDAPAVYDSVKITFSTISAHIDSEWVTVSGDPVTVDLLKWTNGEKLLIGSSDVPPGKYTQIRLIIDDAEIGVDDAVYPLTVPSGAKTGLKFGPQFTVEEGFTYELVFDFDVSRSIVVTGPKKNPTGYKLKPHIRMIATSVSGSISGMVSNPADVPVAYAILDNDTITTSFVDTSSGFFRLAFLPDTTYTVSVVDTNDLRYDQSDVKVTSGMDYDLGSITLE